MHVQHAGRMASHAKFCSNRCYSSKSSENGHMGNATDTMDS